MKNKIKLLGITLLCLACASEALTLGRIRGAALIGKPLDVAVPVQMDAGETATSLCFDAEVFHADTRQDASRVRVLVEASAQTQIANVRILSSAPVDEPVVTVYLRTGCGQKTSRRYVLLADVPSEVETPTGAATPVIVVAAVSAPVKANLSPAEPPEANAKSPRVAASPPRQTDRHRVAAKRPQVGVPLAASNIAATPDKNKAGRSSGQSRLKLDPLDMFSDRVANIDSFMTFAPTEDALRSQQKVQTLENDVKALRASAALNEASLADLKARLQKAQAQRFPNGLIYSLIALVLICLSAVAYLWYLQRRVQSPEARWWTGATAGLAPAAAEPAPGPDVGRAEKALDQAHVLKQPHSAAMPGHAGSAAEIDVSMVEMSHSSFDELMQSEASRRTNHKQPLSPAPTVQTQHAPGRSDVAFRDIRRQVEFLVSRGSTERAVGLLKKLAHDGDEPHPEVYLDLLGLLHSLGMKTDFQQIGVEFSRLFNGRVPEFASFSDEGRALESCPEVMSRIAALWPTAKAQAVIEACIFRDPQHPVSEPFDLAAFRDLLLLHAIVQTGKTRLDASPGIDARASQQSDLVLYQAESLDLLDLDLSDSEAAVAVDVHLPLSATGDEASIAQGVGPAPTVEADSFLNFDLPEVPKQSLPGGDKGS